MLLTLFSMSSLRLYSFITISIYFITGQRIMVKLEDFLFNLHPPDVRIKCILLSFVKLADVEWRSWKCISTIRNDETVLQLNARTCIQNKLNDKNVTSFRLRMKLNDIIMIVRYLFSVWEKTMWKKRKISTNKNEVFSSFDRSHESHILSYVNCFSHQFFTDNKGNEFT